MSPDFAPGITSSLLLELVTAYGSPGRSLVIGGEAALPNCMSNETVFLPTDIREHDLASVSTITDIAPATYSQALIPVPPDRDLLRSHLLLAATSVQSGGTIYICGPNTSGGKSAVKDATELFGTPRWSSYRAKHRMAMFDRSEIYTPDWAGKLGIAPGTWETFTVATPTEEITLDTRAGVFAGAKLDAGTKLLLEHLQVTPDTSVLDLGCGVGIIGITASRRGAGSVTLADANLLAIDTAERNITNLNIPNAEVIASDVYSHLEGRRFDLIVSNPPFHQGKQVDLSVANRIIEEAPNHLNQGGRLLLVANAFLAYQKRMEAVFDRVETVAATPQYHVIRAW